MTIETFGWVLFAALLVVFVVVMGLSLRPTVTPKAERVRRKAFNSAEWTVRLATTLSSPDCVCDWTLYRTVWHGDAKVESKFAEGSEYGTTRRQAELLAQKSAKYNAKCIEKAEAETKEWSEGW